MLNPRLSHLRCIACASEYDVSDRPMGCPACADAGCPASLEAVYRGPAAGLQPARKGYKWGAWLPYLDGIALGEGDTPLLELPRLARKLGIARLSAKHEGLNPTGSHKDRMAAQAITRAQAVGARKVVLASSGNAAVSAAAYCAVAGIACEVATYADMPQPYATALARLGARRVEFGDSMARWAHVRRALEQDGAFALTNYSVPAVGSPVFGVEGYRAIALELAHDGCIPDHVLVPTARGDLLWGLYAGLRDLHDAGLIDRLPRLWAVEPFPRLLRVLQGASAQDQFAGSTAQFSVAGATVTLQQVRAVQASGGSAVVAGDAQAAEGADLLGREGLWVELCAAATVGALQSLMHGGHIRPDEHALLILTAKGDRDPGLPQQLV